MESVSMFEDGILSFIGAMSITFLVYLIIYFILIKIIQFIQEFNDMKEKIGRLELDNYHTRKSIQQLVRNYYNQKEEEK